MSALAVRQVADALLYEGYLLYPYRASSVKNQQRWTFGRVYPLDSGLADGAAEPGLMQTECLLEDSASARLEVSVRFLHIVDVRDEGHPVRRVGQEAVEREVTCTVSLADVAGRQQRHAFAFPAGRDAPASLGREGDAAAARVQWPISGVLELGVERTELGVCKVTVRTLNHTPFQGAAGGGDVHEVLLRTFVSTHAILNVEGSRFISLLDPPASVRELTATCRNVGAWPVLAGDERNRDTMLASPIILGDYPRVAPESHGDMFDGTEIDELLTLRIQTLTDEEKREMRAGDGRARALLERAESVGGERLLDLHGAIRELWSLDAANGADDDLRRPFVLSASCATPALGAVTADGTELHAGDGVRLRPAGGADAFDFLLAGQTAIIESIEQDYEGRVFLAVTLAADPGRDLGREGKPGHRFFFRPDEVELLRDDRANRHDHFGGHVPAEQP